MFYLVFMVVISLCVLPLSLGLVLVTGGLFDFSIIAAGVPNSSSLVHLVLFC